jgi:hypothetical protein
VVGICENARQPLLSYIPGIDEDESTAAVAYYEPANYLCWLARFILSLHVESTASVLLSFFFHILIYIRELPLPHAHFHPLLERGVRHCRQYLRLPPYRSGFFQMMTEEIEKQIPKFLLRINWIQF